MLNRAKFDAALARYSLLGINNKVVVDLNRNVRAGYDSFLVMNLYGTVTSREWVDAINFIKIAGGNGFVYADNSTSCLEDLCTLLWISGVEIVGNGMVSLLPDRNPYNHPAVTGLLIMFGRC